MAYVWEPEGGIDMTPLTNVPMAKQNLAAMGTALREDVPYGIGAECGFRRHGGPSPGRVFQRFDQVLSQCSGQQDLPFGLNVNVLDLLWQYYDTDTLSAEDCARQIQERAEICCRSNGVPGRVAIDRSSCTGAAGYMIPSAPCDRGPRSGSPSRCDSAGLRLLRGDYREKPISMLLVLCLLLALFACSNADQEAIYSSALAEGESAGNAVQSVQSMAPASEDDLSGELTLRTPVAGDTLNNFAIFFHQLHPNVTIHVEPTFTDAAEWARNPQRHTEQLACRVRQPFLCRTVGGGVSVPGLLLPGHHQFSENKGAGVGVHQVRGEHQGVPRGDQALQLCGRVEPGRLVLFLHACQSENYLGAARGMGWGDPLIQQFDEYNKRMDTYLSLSTELNYALLDIKEDFFDNNLITAEECAQQMQSARRFI